MVSELSKMMKNHSIGSKKEKVRLTEKPSNKEYTVYMGKKVS